MEEILFGIMNETGEEEFGGIVIEIKEIAFGGIMIIPLSARIIDSEKEIMSKTMEIFGGIVNEIGKKSFGGIVNKTVEIPFGVLWIIIMKQERKDLVKK